MSCFLWNFVACYVVYLHFARCEVLSQTLSFLTWIFCCIFVNLSCPLCALYTVVWSYNLVLEQGSLLFVTESCSSLCDSSGCWGPGDDQCLQCAGYSLHGHCVDFCDLANGYFLDSTTRECWPCHPECLNSCTGPVSVILLHTCDWDPVFSCSLCVKLDKYTCVILKRHFVVRVHAVLSAARLVVVCLLYQHISL